jgi:hypothetical protein
LSLGDAGGVRSTVVILHMRRKYRGLGRLLASWLLGLEDFEGGLDVIKVVVAVGVARAQCHVSRELEYVVSGHKECSFSDITS